MILAECAHLQVSDDQMSQGEDLKSRISLRTSRSLPDCSAERQQVSLGKTAFVFQRKDRIINICIYLAAFPYCFLQQLNINMFGIYESFWGERICSAPWKLKLENSSNSSWGPFSNGLLWLKNPDEDRVPGELCQESIHRNSAGYRKREALRWKPGLVSLLQLFLWNSNVYFGRCLDKFYFHFPFNQV